MNVKSISKKRIRPWRSIKVSKPKKFMNNPPFRFGGAACHSRARRQLINSNDFVFSLNAVVFKRHTKPDTTQCKLRPTFEFQGTFSYFFFISATLA